MKHLFTRSFLVEIRMRFYSFILAFLVFSFPLVAQKSPAKQQDESTKDNKYVLSIAPPAALASNAVLEVVAEVPEWAWAVKAGAGAGLSVAVDKEGNSYVAGLLGENKLIKYDADGQVLWAEQAGYIGRGVAVDDAGNSYFLGDYSGTITLGDYTLSGGGIFLVKYDPAGQVIWAKRIGDGYGNSIAVDKEGNSYIGGYGNISTTFETGEYIAKLDPTGQVIWAQLLIPGYFSSIFSGYNNIELDEAGNSYVLGSFTSTITVGDVNLTSNGGSDILVIKYDPAGQVLWARHVGGLEWDFVGDLAVDAQGNTFVTGELRAESIGEVILPAGGFIVKYDAAGQVIWAVEASGRPGGVWVDKQGDVYVGGDNAQSPSFSNLYVAKYKNATGDIVYMLHTGGEGDIDAYGFAIDDAGNSYLTGEISGISPQAGTVVFGDITLITPPGGGIGEAFLAKLGTSLIEPEPLFVDAGPDQTVYYGYTPAACAIITATGATGGTPGYTYRWSTGQTGASIQVCPHKTTVYTLTITDAEGRTFSDEVQVCVIDVSCGSTKKPKVQVFFNPSGKPGKGHILCIPEKAVPVHLALGSVLGNGSATACDGSPLPEGDINLKELFSLLVYPNPVSDYLNIISEKIADCDVLVTLYNAHGKQVYQRSHSIRNGRLAINIQDVNLSKGLNYMKVSSLFGTQTMRIIKN